MMSTKLELLPRIKAGARSALLGGLLLGMLVPALGTAAEAPVAIPAAAEDDP